MAYGVIRTTPVILLRELGTLLRNEGAPRLFVAAVSQIIAVGSDRGGILELILTDS